MRDEITIFLKDYQPYPYAVHSVFLDVSLYDDCAIIINEMQLESSSSGELRLYGQDLTCLGLLLNGQALEPQAYEINTEELIIFNAPSTCTLKVTTKIAPQKNTALSGLYRSNDLFCTQCEAQGFRRITYFPDRPDVLSRFTTKISADYVQCPILLSNGNLMDSGLAEDGRHWALWHDPFKKPCYLFALVAGDLAVVRDEFVTMSDRCIDLRLYVEKGQEDQCAHALKSLKNAMRWDEQVYGLEYDLDIFMIVAVSYFNMGAMENKGLNIFNTKYILAQPDRATDRDFANIEGVVAHEYFHNWTGNRVTCRDWFQLSLKEGLTVFRDQEFSRDMNSRDVGRIEDVKVLRQHQFLEDSGAMAHPVQPASYQEINNFYTATIYNKGAEVIRMMQTIVGQAGFRLGMDLYFARHDGQAVTIDDFVAAIADANAVDLSLFKRWYTQAGTPRVVIQTQYANGLFHIHCTQNTPKTPDGSPKEPLVIPIKMALFTPQGERIMSSLEVLMLTQAEQTFVIENQSEKPVLSVFRDFSAPVMVQYDRPQEEHLFLLTHETDGFARWESMQRVLMQHMTHWYANGCDPWPEDLVAIVRTLFNTPAHNQALHAQLLTLPVFSDLFSSLVDVDVMRLDAVCRLAKKSLGQALWSTAEACYEHLWAQEDHAMDASAYGRRHLRNVCLDLLFCADEAKALPLCQQQFAMAKTMTDQLSSLRWLCQGEDASVRAQALMQFEKQWHQDALVMDQWFATQASSPHPDCLEQVQSLMLHPAFDLKNPNKVRALIGTFTQVNHRSFHADDGQGYRFLTDQLLNIDPMNSQLSARLAAPFTLWKRYHPSRQALLQEQLQRLASNPLSSDLREVVMKCLDEQPTKRTA